MSAEPLCDYPGCDVRSFASCAHGARCGEHLNGMCYEGCSRELALIYMKFLRDVCDPAACLAKQLVLTKVPMLESFADIFEVFLPAYRRAYTEAGAPLGPGDEAMWRYHEEHLQERVAPRYNGLRLVTAGEELDPQVIEVGRDSKPF